MSTDATIIQCPPAPPASGPRFPRLGAAAFAATYPLVRLAGALMRMHSPTGAYARERIASMRQKLERGETVYVLGIGPGGHNAGVGLVEASNARGIRLIANHEEERFRAEKHFQRYPDLSVQVLAAQMKRLGIEPAQIHAACASWDYPYWTSKAIESVAQELPGSLRLFTREASPQMNVHCVLDAFKAPRRLGRRLNADGSRMPVISLRHHDNHAWLSWGVSPFATCDEPVMVLVIDGAGDDGAISTYVAERGSLRMLYRNDNIWDSLGMMYGILSSSQGGWPLLSSEGRYMGAAAWGDSNRLTNPYYGQLRDVFVFGSDGRIFLNRSLANWHRGGCQAPYTKRLARMIGEPILPKGMWNPDAVLRVEDIAHAPITVDRVDKAAAVQLVFEDALFHIVQHLIRTTRSTRLVMTGGTALNCVANMRLLEQFDARWYERNLGMKDASLHLWVPPIPGDAGVAIGAAYHFACLAGAKPGESLQHAFYCGMPPSRGEIEDAIAKTPEIAHRRLGNIAANGERERLADLVAFIVSHDGIVGIYQGAAETGPRALGHRSILANPANPKTLETLNRLRQVPRADPAARADGNPCGGEEVVQPVTGRERRRFQRLQLHGADEPGEARGLRDDSGGDPLRRHLPRADRPRGGGPVRARLSAGHGPQDRRGGQREHVAQRRRPDRADAGARARDAEAERRHACAVHDRRERRPFRGLARRRARAQGRRQGPSRLDGRVELRPVAGTTSSDARVGVHSLRQPS